MPFRLHWEGYVVSSNWSYHTTVAAHKDRKHHSPDHLNKMGVLGWELVSVVAHSDEDLSIFYWKREALGTHEPLFVEESKDTSEPHIEQDDAKSEELLKREKNLNQLGPTVGPFSIGDSIPEFELRSTDGTYFSTKKLTNKTVLYFYPADGTEYCTIQAKGFSAVYETMTDMGLDIIGISPDDLDAHNKFKDDEGIPFHLLYDEKSKVCSKFGLLQNPPPNEMYPVRTTFLVDVDMKILGLWNDVDVSTHSDDVVSFVLDVLEKAN